MGIEPTTTYLEVRGSVVFTRKPMALGVAKVIIGPLIGCAVYHPLWVCSSP
jgi:hypothetical protein